MFYLKRRLGGLRLSWEEGKVLCRAWSGCLTETRCVHAVSNHPMHWLWDWLELPSYGQRNPEVKGKEYSHLAFPVGSSLQYCHLYPYTKHNAENICIWARLIQNSWVRDGGQFISDSKSSNQSISTFCTGSSNDFSWVTRGRLPLPGLF